MLYFCVMSFAQNLVTARKRLRMTQERLARELGITAQAISQWENEETVPELERIPQIAKALRIPIGWLLGAKGEAIELDPDGPWSVWQKLTPAQRRQAIEIINVIANQPS